MVQREFNTNRYVYQTLAQLSITYLLILLFLLERHVSSFQYMTEKRCYPNKYKFKTASLMWETKSISLASPGINRLNLDQKVGLRSIYESFPNSISYKANSYIY